MKFFKKLFIFTVTFCLLHVQYQSGVPKVHLFNHAEANPLKAEAVYSGEEAGQAEGFINQILYLAIGFVAASMIIKAKSSIPYDVMLGAAAGAIMLIGELAMMSKNSDQVAAIKLAYSKDHEGKVYNNYQIGAIRNQLEMNENLRDALKTKRNIQIAASVAFGAAIIASLSIVIAGKSIGAASLVASNSTIAAAAVAIPVGAPIIAVCTAANVSFGIYKGTYLIPRPSLIEFTSTKTLLATMSACPTYLAFTSYVAISDSYCQGSPGTSKTDPFVKPFQKIAATNGQNIKTDQSQKQEKRNAFTEILSKGFNLFFPKANAGPWMNILSIGLGGLLTTISVQGKTLDLGFGSAGKRAIAWGVMEGLVGFALTKTIKHINDTESNIEKLDKILNNFSALRDGQEVNLADNGNISGQQEIARNTKNKNIKEQEVSTQILDDNEKTPCLGGSDKKGRCFSIQRNLRVAAAANNFDIGSAIANLEKPIGLAADGFSGTNKLTKSTLDNINKIGSKKNAIENNKREVISRLNDILKKNNEKPFSFSQRVAASHNNLKSELSKSLLKQGLTPRLAAKQLGISTGSKVDVANANGQSKKEPIKKGKLKQNRFFVKTKPTQIDFGFGEKEKKKAILNDNNNSKETSLSNNEEYVINDISERQETSLFKIISIRYIKSGYKKLSDL